jgi:hypothetical protein
VLWLFGTAGADYLAWYIILVVTEFLWKINPDMQTE